MSGVQQITVDSAEADQRLDRWFKRRFPELTHGRLEKLLRTGQVRVDGKRAKASDRVAAGQVLRIPPLGPSQDTGTEADGDRAVRVKAEVKVSDKDAAALRAAVLYKDPDVLVINKPAGLAVQGGTGLDKNLDAMLDVLKFDAAERPRLVHRLDRDTSGCLVLARSAKAAQALTAAFRHKEARKVYWAVVVGAPKLDRGKIDAPLSKQPAKGGERVQIDEEEGRFAITHFAVIERAGKKAAWLALLPVTGRTHQLRAHCVALGTPILGDGKYAGQEAFVARDELPNQMHLHARSIRIPHPKRGWIAVEAPLPPHMQKTWKFFGFAPEPDHDPFAGLEL